MSLPSGNPDMRSKMEKLIRAKQKEIVSTLEEIDGKKFLVDEWERPNKSGGGISTVIEDGNVFEKGGVNISIVKGVIPPAGVKKMSSSHSSLQGLGSENESIPFWVCGLSMILHPHNPMAPTVHLNYRYFETQKADGTPRAWWFGGGSDLTPHYLFEEDAVLFHQTLKEACDKHSEEYYPRFKKWCDEYFFNTHRGEARGIGGIFFDDLADRDANEIYEFVESAFDAFLKSYVPILKRRKDMPYTEENKKWQKIRHGRYVEFNLVHDRGTAFGLHTPSARIESILVSLPSTAAWKYNYHPEPDTPEAELLEVLKNPREWV